MDASVNRVVVAGLPGVPDRLAGRQAHAILSAEAVAAAAGDQGIAVARHAIADDLGVALQSADLGRRRAARAVAAELGLRLACLLATLRDSGTARAQGWSAWRRAYLGHWAAVDEVHLAGGLLAGGVGPAVTDEANAVLDRLGFQTRATSMPWPAWAALVGAARRQAVEAGDVLAVDLGGSRAKAGLVRVLPGGAAELTALVALRVPFDPRDQPSRAALEELLAAVLDSAARGTRSLRASVRAVAFSVACYLDREGRCASRGSYANLPDLVGDPWRGRLEARFGRPVPVGVVHDGTAAAASVPAAGGTPGAVLVMGSALGVGFPPPDLPPWRELTVRGWP